MLSVKGRGRQAHIRPDQLIAGRADPLAGPSRKEIERLTY